MLPALAISLLLHGLLLQQQFRPPADAGAPVALVATLRGPAAAALPMHAPPPPIRLRPELHPVPVVAPAVAPAHVAAPQAPAVSTTEAAARSAPASANAVITGGAPASAAAAPAAGEGPDADGIRRYRLALARQARRYRHYPARALEANIAGQAEVRVAVAADGVPQDIVLARSSGSDLLDAAALDMIRKAAPRTEVPALLRRRAFAVSLPVEFDPANE